MNILKIYLIFLVLLFLLMQTTVSAQVSVSYTYDNAQRLTKAMYSNGTQISYTYDAVGNRTTMITCDNTRTSLKTGNWNDTSVWSCSSVPTFTTPTIVDTPHTVTIPTGTTGSAKSLNEKGKLIINGVLSLPVK